MLEAEMNKSKLIWGIGLSIIFLTGLTDSVAQTEYEDVVYLKNGEIRRGIIIEEIPFKQIKIQTKDGNVFVYGYDEIERKTKEKQLYIPFPYQPTLRSYSRKSPGAALALSAIPGFFGANGGGQFYNGEIGKGIIFFSTGLISAVWLVDETNKTGYYQDSNPEVPALIFLGNWIAGMFDAYFSADRINNGISLLPSSSNSNFAFGPTYMGGKSLGLVTRVMF
jgi:hypothetical protein